MGTGLRGRRLQECPHQQLPARPLTSSCQPHPAAPPPEECLHAPCPVARRLGCEASLRLRKYVSFSAKPDRVPPTMSISGQVSLSSSALLPRAQSTIMTASSATTTAAAHLDALGTAALKAADLGSLAGFGFICSAAAEPQNRCTKQEPPALLHPRTLR